MKALRHLLISLMLIFCGLKADAQFNIRDSIHFSMIGFSGGFELPGGNLADRFGNNFNIGIHYHYKFKSNWLVGFEGQFFFGDNVKENSFLNQYMTSDGNIISGEGQFADVTLSERGWKFYFEGGKIFPLIGPNPNSGLLASFGAGYIQHKIYIDTPGFVVPYLEGDYRKGYD